MSSSSNTAVDKKLVEDWLLQELDEKGRIADSDVFLSAHGIAHEGGSAALAAVLLSLFSQNYVSYTHSDKVLLALSAEGLVYAERGTPEFQVFNAVSADLEAATPQAEIEAALGNKDVAKLGLNQCMSKKWLEFADKKAGTLRRKVAAVVDELKDALASINASGAADVIKPDILDQLKKRKMVVSATHRTYAIEKGANFARERRQLATDLNVDLLKDDKWRELDFKEYNFNALGESLSCGCLHPLMKVRSQFRQIFLEMGFSEMPTNKYVESSFWNFDTLFQPQQHPARDAHDTFFVKEPAKTLTLPHEYVQEVRKIHEQGGYGSIGYRYDWKLEEAEKNILRTHTTAVSSRMLYKLSRGPFKPQRYFSIDRVFRNETLDSTHLAEFHQIEGLIADRNLTLGDLIGVIATFFKRIGIPDVKFKPAYNPYTEPSMEIFGYSPQLKKWIEVGNSGIFRPEMLRPMGLPEDVRVIAWGLGLERPTMLLYGIKHIRDLFGPKVKLNIIQRNPICRFDKTQKLDEEKEQQTA